MEMSESKEVKNILILRFLVGWYINKIEFRF